MATLDVMIVEPDDLYSKVICRVLEGNRLRCLSVLSVKGASRAVRNHIPRCIIVAEGERGERIYETVEQVLRIPVLKFQRPAPRVLALVGKFSELDVTDALDAGADDCLVKPFSPSELIVQVRRMISCHADLTPDLRAAYMSLR
jgi:DNA-binding response OmpR family regulator